jgi:site-specific DNA-methyltransferase (adenine-specific)
MNIQEWIESGKPWNVILHGDCMDLMKHFNDNEIHLCITDPPYGIGAFKNLKVNNNRIQKIFQKSENFNNLIPNENYFNELFRISEFQIIWGANNFNLPTTEYFIIWDKQQTVDNFASAEYAWTNVKKPAKVYRYSIHKHNQVNKIHPTQKPISLYRWLLQNYAKKGDKILDTHSGSGSCAIACFLEHHDFLAIEKDEDYYKASVARYSEVVSQGRLF